MRLTGSEIFLKCLQAEGVHTVFGHPGGVVLHAYDVMLDYPMRHILCRHEQVAVHAVEGYYKASGNTGTAFVTSGPGATNTITGLTDALMDSMGIVVFTGQVPTAVMGCDAFQEADVVGTTRTCTKHNFLASKTEELPRMIKEAYYIARSGRPGPVLVDLPKDVIMGRAEFKGYPDEVSIRGYNPSLNGHPCQIKRAAELIASAKRPVIYGGGGIIHADASAELTDLVNLTQIPTTLTLMGLGALDTSHPLWLGMLGMHGTYTANMAMVHIEPRPGELVAETLVECLDFVDWDLGVNPLDGAAEDREIALGVSADANDESGERGFGLRNREVELTFDSGRRAESGVVDDADDGDRLVVWRCK